MGCGFHVPRVRSGPPLDAHEAPFAEHVLLPEQGVYTIMVPQHVRSARKRESFPTATSSDCNPLVTLSRSVTWYNQSGYEHCFLARLGAGELAKHGI